MRAPAARLPTYCRDPQALRGTCLWPSPYDGRASWAAMKYIPTERRVESFANDLNMRRGIVSGRVALLP